MLIPAVGYLRKSTKGDRLDRHGKKRERQERSIAQQKAEILKLAAGRFDIVAWFEDEGVSGWKREAKRPDFARMLGQAKQLGAQAVLCDHIDRFSRATYDDVHDDTKELRKSGVRWIVAASHGEYDLTAGRRNDIGGIITFAVAVWGAHEYSRNLARRISLARRNAAEAGRWTGGPTPYGLVSNGEGGLKHGDPKHIEIIRWLFDQFGNHHRSICSLAGDLNIRQKVSGPTGGTWHPKSVGLVLRQRAYRGDFLFNRTAFAGQFFGVDADGEVVEKPEGGRPAGKVFLTEGAFEPVVDPELFDRVQQRLAMVGSDRTRRKNMGYALTGCLVCDHCGAKLYGVQVKRSSGKRSPTVYRCNGNNTKGRGTCKQYQVREDAILPHVLRMLGEELTDLTALLAKPKASQPKDDGKAKVQAQRGKLAKKIQQAMLARIESDDKRTRREYDGLISGWRDELERLDAELAAESDAPAPSDWTWADAEAALRQIQQELAAIVHVPVPDGAEYAKYLQSLGLDPDDAKVKFVFRRVPSVTADRRRVNQVLQGLGCEVRLRWSEGRVPAGKPYKKNGKAVQPMRHVIQRGRLRLGQKEGNLPRYVLETTASRSSPAASATRSAPPPSWSGPTAAGSRNASATGARTSSTSCVDDTRSMIGTARSSSRSRTSAP